MSDTEGYDEYAFVADLYDYVRPYRERPDIPFFVDAAKGAGSPILEVGCGTGRILIPTARAGLEVVGLDLSPHMLAVCRDRLGQESPDVQARVRLVQGDMRAFKLGRKFKLITVPFRPFQHLLAVQDQCACLETLRAHLTDDGRLVLDLFNPSLEALASRPDGQEVGEEPEFSAPDGRRVVRRHRIVAHDRFAQVNQVELLYYVTYPDGRHERLVHAFPMRYLFRFEAEHLLARCGFEVEHLYAGFDKSAYGSKYPGELIFIARKAAPHS
jgi:SAM-dependent methyltransferase